MKKKDNTEKETALPFVRKFVTFKPKVSEGTSWARLEVENTPETVEAVEALTPRQKAGLVTLAVRNILQHGGSQHVRGLLTAEKPIEKGSTVKVDFLEMIDLKDTAKASKAALLDDLIQQIARAALAGDMDEVGRLQQRHLDMKKG